MYLILHIFVWSHAINPLSLVNWGHHAVCEESVLLQIQWQVRCDPLVLATDAIVVVIIPQWSYDNICVCGNFHLTNCTQLKLSCNFFFFFYYRARSICPRCTTAYRLIVRPWTPLSFRRPYSRRQVPPRPNNARDPSSKRWNCGRECWPIILPKYRLPRSI